jgi:hypothetical protein
MTRLQISLIALSSLKNAILTPLICELNHLRFILNGRTTINNDFRKNSSPKGGRTTRKRGKNRVDLFNFSQNCSVVSKRLDFNVSKILARF